MDLDKIREEKLRELQARQEEEQKLQEQINSLEENAKQFLDKDSLLRFGNLKSAFPEKTMQVAFVISKLAEQGQLNKKLNDMEFKELLKSLNPRKEIKIVRK